MDAGALEGRLRAKVPDLDARAAAVQEEFGGLLDREAALLLLADEHGLLPAQADLGAFGVEAPAERDLEGVLERLTATRTFRRADGSTGFVADADVRTPEGLKRVTLWDEPVRAAQSKVGQRVRFTRLAERGRAGERALHTTRGTQVLPASPGVQLQPDHEERSSAQRGTAAEFLQNALDR